MMKTRWIVSFLIGVVGLSASAIISTHASDHDDGTQSNRDNTLNLTDLFVFREDNQTGSASDRGNLVMIMDSHGHTPAGQQVFFNTKGLYDFHISRVSADQLNATPTGSEDVIMRFQFGDPDATQHQPITTTMIMNGQSISPANVQSSPVTTTTLADGMAGTITTNTVTWPNGMKTTYFAGLREDPFFFDSEQFFKVRAGAAGLGPSATFRTPDQAVDAFAKQNVNSIVVRVPINFLQSNNSEPVFDVWETTKLQ